MDATNNSNPGTIPVPQQQVFGLFLIYTRDELGIEPDEIVPPTYGKTIGVRFIYRGTRVFDNSFIAHEAYANTRCPYSQLLKASSVEELEKEIHQMLANHANEAWLEEHVYPYV